MKRLIIILLLVLLLGGVGVSAFAYHTFCNRVDGNTFDADGVAIHYTDEGAGTPVILVHGFAVQGDLNWRRNGVVDALRPHFRVITLDLRGHGLSGKPHNTNAYGAEMAEDVVRLMDHLEIEKAHVVGYSLGGFITLKLASLHPDRLITACPCGAGWETKKDSQFFAAIEPLAKRLEAGRGITPPSGQMGADRKKPGLGHTLIIRAVTRIFNDGKALAGVLRSAPGLEVTADELTAIPVPMLTIIGTHDPLAVGVDNMEGRIPDHEIVRIEGATHLNLVRHPEFSGHLVRFLREHSE
ncbi:MAG: alpha/beta fold hydrolase [Candidatus Hydrogenedentota bacterium]